MCFEKMLWGISEMVNAKALQTLAIVFSTPQNLLVSNFWSSRNKSKPLSQLKHVFSENAVAYLRNAAVLELANLCHCVMHPSKLTNKDFWSSRDTRNPFLKQKSFLRTFAIVFSMPENWLVAISGALGTNVSHFLSRNVFWENAVGYLRNGEC